MAKTRQCTEPEPATSISDAPGFPEIGFETHVHFRAPVGDWDVR